MERSGAGGAFRRALPTLIAGPLLLALAACATVVAPLPPGVDVQVTIGNNGATSWRIDSVQGGDVGAAAGDNPTLTLEVGMRYRLVIPASDGIHPFELLTRGASPATDVVLLSEKANVEGGFEEDPDVVFVEEGDGFEFTLTQELADALSGYRCGIHSSSMRGEVDIASP